VSTLSESLEAEQAIAVEQSIDDIVTTDNRPRDVDDALSRSALVSWSVERDVSAYYVQSWLFDKEITEQVTGVKYSQIS